MKFALLWYCEDFDEELTRGKVNKLRVSGLCTYRGLVALQKSIYILDKWTWTSLQSEALKRRVCTTSVLHWRTRGSLLISTPLFSCIVQSRAVWLCNTQCVKHEHNYVHNIIFNAYTYEPLYYTLFIHSSSFTSSLTCTIFLTYSSQTQWNNFFPLG